VTKKDKDILLFGLFLAQLKDKYDIRPTDLIQDYNQEKINEIFDKALSKLSTKESLIKAVTDLYYDLKIK